ncbi:MAG: hypothetical protein SFX74_03920 [Fimbriimonadaceae bacterium]|nr:hypothetical protein [Fimbriimonadaceae bacterium]
MMPFPLCLQAATPADIRVVLVTADLAFRLTIPAGYTLPPVDPKSTELVRSWDIKTPDGGTIRIEVEPRGGKPGDLEAVIDARFTRDRAETPGARVSAEGTRKNLFGETAYVFRRTAPDAPDRLYAIFAAKRTVTTIWTDRSAAMREKDPDETAFWRVALSYAFITDRVAPSRRKDGKG